MATANNTIQTRIQLKNDIEAKWNRAISFIPKKGEMIIYSAETGLDELPAGRTSPLLYARLKVGDGETTVTELPFIDAGTLNGNASILMKYDSMNVFPAIGSADYLYADLSTNKIYHYNNNQYKELSGITVQKEVFGSVSDWNAGSITSATIENNILKISVGTVPQLTWGQKFVVTDVK